MLPVFTLWCEMVNLAASLFSVECIQTPVSDSLAVASLKREIYLKKFKGVFYGMDLLFLLLFNNTLQLLRN